MIFNISCDAVNYTLKISSIDNVIIAIFHKITEDAMINFINDYCDMTKIVKLNIMSDKMIKRIASRLDNTSIILST